MKKQALIKAKEWFNIGDNEFGYACLGLKDKQNKFLSEICFMFNQSVEKYLKGYLVAQDIKIEKTHDLDYLCQQCSVLNKRFKKFRDKCKRLNKYYIPTRYPAHWPIYTKKQAEEAYRIAKDIINFIKKELKFNGL